QGGARRYCIWVGAGLVVDRGDLDPTSFGLQPPSRTPHRLMLRRPGQDRAGGGQASSRAEQREVDGLGARRREGDLGSVGGQRQRCLVPGLVEGGTRGAAFSVQARWVALRS